MKSSRVEKDKTDIQRETEDMKASLDDTVRAKVEREKRDNLSNLNGLDVFPRCVFLRRLF